MSHSSVTISYNFTSVPGDGEEGSELLLSGLSKYTRYSVVIQAFNQVGQGPLSEPVTAQTLEDGELAPTVSTMLTTDKSSLSSAEHGS